MYGCGHRISPMGMHQESLTITRAERSNAREHVWFLRLNYIYKEGPGAHDLFYSFFFSSRVGSGRNIWFFGGTTCSDDQSRDMYLSLHQKFQSRDLTSLFGLGCVLVLVFTKKNKDADTAGMQTKQPMLGMTTRTMIEKKRRNVRVHGDDRWRHAKA
ncbi:hypothetical protein BS47DRAFT_356673 [Hydnum rufescens UP504]|uniref:Uncharacterized protein n=1 Tax=Hydnum rufescens UP504 TaxID=1448309 RepID=A0A9P6DLL8_9AGAM|nr:hypothetical protein BS47DRAFT_356673 [Hydnum rufescens UP504]